MSAEKVVAFYAVDVRPSAKDVHGLAAEYASNVGNHPDGSLIHKVAAELVIGDQGTSEYYLGLLAGIKATVVIDKLTGILAAESKEPRELIFRKLRAIVGTYLTTLIIEKQAAEAAAMSGEQPKPESPA